MCAYNRVKSNVLPAFSLIEVVIAMALLSLILLGMLSIFKQGYFASRKTQQRTIVYNLLREKIEAYSNWSSLDVLDGIPDGNVSNTVISNSEFFHNVYYMLSLAISDGPIPSNRLKRLNVTANWSGGNFSLNTLKADY